MRTIGVRELHQNTSAWLRCVKAGEILEVTEHGRPVATIMRISEDETPFDRMAREGRVRRATGHLLDHLAKHPSLPPVEGVPLPSEVLAEMRSDER